MNNYKFCILVNTKNTKIDPECGLPNEGQDSVITNFIRYIKKQSPPSSRPILYDSHRSHHLNVPEPFPCLGRDDYHIGRNDFDRF